MYRLLILVAIIVVVALLVRRALKMAKGNANERQQAQPSDPGAEAPEAKLVRCVECGAFVPKADAVGVPNGFRCGAGCAPR